MFTEAAASLTQFRPPIGKAPNSDVHTSAITDGLERIVGHPEVDLLLQRCFGRGFEPPPYQDSGS